MDLERTEGIVLRSIPYQERDRILTLFTENAGLISVMIRGVSLKKSTLFLSPFCEAEIIYKRGKSDLHYLRDASLRNIHRALRITLPHLQAASAIAFYLLQSQMPGKKAPPLYTLLVSYLHKIPGFQDPRILQISFLLKLLTHEGLLSLQKTCSSCGKEKALALEGGESLCQICAPSYSTPFTPEEWKQLIELTYAKSFLAMQKIHLSENLMYKTTQFSKEILH